MRWRERCCWLLCWLSSSRRSWVARPRDSWRVYDLRHWRGTPPARWAVSLPPARDARRITISAAGLTFTYAARHRPLLAFDLPAATLGPPRLNRLARRVRVGAGLDQIPACRRRCARVCPEPGLSRGAACALRRAGGEMGVGVSHPLPAHLAPELPRRRHLSRVGSALRLGRLSPRARDHGQGPRHRVGGLRDVRFESFRYIDDRPAAAQVSEGDCADVIVHLPLCIRVPRGDAAHGYGHAIARIRQAARSAHLAGDGQLRGHVAGAQLRAYGAHL